MEGQAVEEALPRQRDEVLHGQRRIEHGQLDLNRAAIGLDVHLGGHGRRMEARRSRTQSRAGRVGAGRILTAASLDGSSCFSSAAARTRTAQSLSASASVSAGVAASAPYAASAAVPRRAPHRSCRVASCLIRLREQRRAGRRLQLAERRGSGRAHDRIVGLQTLEQEVRRIGRAKRGERREHRGTTR